MKDRCIWSFEFFVSGIYKVGYSLFDINSL